MAKKNNKPNIINLSCGYDYRTAALAAALIAKDRERRNRLPWWRKIINRFNHAIPSKIIPAIIVNLCYSSAQFLASAAPSLTTHGKG
jgi:hypothetical protein